MEQKNLTSLTEFILVGVTRQPELQAPLFVVFLIIYTVTVVGNLGMIVLTQVDSRLHTPMYFFIKHLAFIDLGNSTVICPKMLVNFIVDQNTISYYACATQLAFFLMFIISEFFILSAMAYDRYLAICNPLLYNVIMSQRLCHVLVGIPYLYVTVVGNLGMIVLTQVDSSLHTPMYFFIKHLAFIDLGNSTVICPKMLVNFIVDQNTISYYACATQLAFFLMFIITEYFILSAMAYDRYLAICNPLLYNVIMSQRLCHVLVGIPYLYVKKKTTSYYECATQLGGFLLFIVAEVFTLAVMAYDRYVAICNPLHYMVVISRHICLLLAFLTYLYGFSTGHSATLESSP
ncbi:Olfactory Receptor 8K5 [Manis pentadactyla]|nr:Olfactory Receptor 8K5 [Manis pentadactyla]